MKSLVNTEIIRKSLVETIPFSHNFPFFTSNVWSSVWNWLRGCWATIFLFLHMIKLPFDITTYGEQMNIIGRLVWLLKSEVMQREKTWGHFYYFYFKLLRSLHSWHNTKLRCDRRTDMKLMLTKHNQDLYFLLYKIHRWTPHWSSHLTVCKAENKCIII